MYRDPNAEYIDVPSMNNLRATDLKGAVKTAKTNISALGANSLSGTFEMMALVTEGSSLTLDQFFNQIDTSGALGNEIRKVWAADSIPLTIPSDVIEAEAAGINANKMSETEYRAAFTKFKTEKYSKDNEYAGLSDDEKRTKVDELIKQHAYDNDDKFFVNATSGAVVFLDNLGADMKANIDEALLIRMANALPAKGMTFQEALPGKNPDIFENKSDSGVALDRLGRPYGTDKFATLLNASEEFGDVFIDALVSKIPYIGDALNVAMGTMEGTAASMRDIKKATKEAFKNGELDNIVEWQKVLSDSKGDAELALDRLNTSFYQTALLAGSVEGFADAATARLITKTNGVKTIGDLYNKLTPAMRKSLGITVPIGVATAIGGGTEALQQKITEDSLKKFGITVETEQGAAFLLGAAGQGGAVSVATVSSGITNAIKTKYKNGDVSAETLAFINNEIINPEGSAYDPDFVTVDERRKADAAFKAAEETKAEPSSFDPALEAAGVSPASLSPTTIAELESAGVSPTGLSPTTIAELEAAGVSPASLSPTTIAELEAAGEISSNLSPSVIADLEAAGVSPAGVTADKKTITIEELAAADINLKRNFADLKGEYSFTTAKGSEYKVDNEGKGIRNKFDKKTKKFKLEPKTQKTIFMETNSATRAFQSKFQYGKDPVQFIPSEVAGKGKLIYTKDYTDKDGVFHVEGSEDELIGDIDYSLVPEVGMTPIDIYDSKNEAKNPNPEAGGAAAGIHFGNKITSLGTDNFKSSITTNEVMKTFYPDLDTKPEADDVSSIVGEGATQPDSSIDIFGEGEVDPRIPKFDGVDPAIDKFGPGEVDPRIPDFDGVDPAIDKFGPGEVDPRIPDFDTPSSELTPEEVADIIGGDPENVTSDDVDAVTETIEAIEAEINAETATDTTVSPVISVNTDLPDEEDEERRRRRKKAREQAYLQATGQSVDPNNIAGIDYLYDFKSKFANPQQAEQFDLNAGKFNRPYDLADIIATGEQPETQKPVANDDFLQLIEAAKMNPDIINQETRGLNLFPVDETEKIGINSPYTAESKEDTTQRLLNLINSSKA